MLGGTRRGSRVPVAGRSFLTLFTNTLEEPRCCLANSDESEPPCRAPFFTTTIFRFRLDFGSSDGLVMKSNML